MPKQGGREIIANKPGTPAPLKLNENPMLITEEKHEDVIVGADLFIESDEQPGNVAEQCQLHAGQLFKLVTISNRGTQVWPTGSVYTNLINQYRVRFESVNNEGLKQEDVLQLYSRMTANFKVCSVELLNMWDGQKAYSLAQGQ
ncbi:MAG: hypothetical protein ACO3AY_04730 [Chitinophagaceae bacterium]